MSKVVTKDFKLFKITYEKPFNSVDIRNNKFIWRIGGYKFYIKRYRLWFRHSVIYRFPDEEYNRPLIQIGDVEYCCTDYRCKTRHDMVSRRPWISFGFNGIAKSFRISFEGPITTYSVTFVGTRNDLPGRVR